MSGRRRVVGVCLLATLGALLVPGTPGRAAPEAKTLTFSYDAAGRLVSAAYPGGRAVRYEYDPSGNLTARKSGVLPEWRLAVSKPGPGAWAFEVSDTGAVTGYGADAVRGFLDLGGSLAIADKAVTGRIDVLDPDDGAVLLTFPLAGKVKRVKRTGAIRTLVLRTVKANPSGKLVATAWPVAAGNAAFTGTYASTKNQLVAGGVKEALGTVTFTEDGGRWFSSTLSGALGGTLISDPRGKAFGEIRRGADAWLVSGLLRAVKKPVTLATPRGAPASAKVTLRK